jgi:hypothetical protein
MATRTYSMILDHSFHSMIVIQMSFDSPTDKMTVIHRSAERYDPREGFWTLLPSMSARRGSHSVAVMGESL